MPFISVDAGGSVPGWLPDVAMCLVLPAALVLVWSWLWSRRRRMWPVFAFWAIALVVVVLWLAARDNDPPEYCGVVACDGRGLEAMTIDVVAVYVLANAVLTLPTMLVLGLLTAVLGPQRPVRTPRDAALSP